MIEIKIDAPPEADIFVDEFMTGRRYLTALVTSPVGDLVTPEERRVALNAGDEGLLVGLKGQELYLGVETVGGVSMREALAVREHDLAKEAGRPIFYRPADVAEEDFSRIVAQAANEVFVQTGAEHRLEDGDVLAKPLRGHGYVALADEGVVPAELADLVRSPLFQKQLSELLAQYQGAELRDASLARMREEMATPDMSQAIGAMRVIAAQRSETSAGEPDIGNPKGEVVYLKGPQPGNDGLVRADETTPKPRKRKVAVVADLELPSAARRALAAATARSKAVDGMFARALEHGLRIEAKGKQVSVADMATGKDNGLAGAVSERLRTIPQAQLDLIYVQTRAAARQGFMRKADEGTTLAMAMLETEYRMRRRQPVADQSLKGRFVEKFGKLLEAKTDHVDRLHRNVVQEKMMRERIGEGDISFLRIDPANPSSVKRTIDLWSRGMDEVRQANFANALSMRGVPDAVIQASLKVVPKRDDVAHQEEVAAVARLASAKGNGR